MASLAFAPYAPPRSIPDAPTAATTRINRALAAVLWVIAIATVVFARHWVASL